MYAVRVFLLMPTTFTQKGALLGERIMSCFSCCEDDDINRPNDGGGAYMVKNAAGNPKGSCQNFFGQDW